jgi:IclR family acetate operon transcriptional repressor
VSIPTLGENAVAFVGGVWLRCAQWQLVAMRRKVGRDQQMLDTGVTASTRTVERALGLLAEVCASPPLSLSECARRAALPTSTALRLLRTLEGGGWLTRDSRGAFRPGMRIIQIGASALSRQSLVELAQPSLTRIVEQTGESTYLVVRGAGETALYLAMTEGTHPIRHTSWVGRAIELADLAVGAALTGSVPEAGYVAQRDRREPDITAIAAPVRHLGGIAAAINLLGPTYRIDEPTAHRYGRIVSAEAAHVSGLLGVLRSGVTAKEAR